MSYRPICDVWILGRPKVKFHGAYPGGFLHRARALLGVGPNDRVLHVCAGRIDAYPYRGLGPNDRTVDINPALKPDFVCDVSKSLPKGLWDAILIDPPYTSDDAKMYGDYPLPNPNKLLRLALETVRPGRRVGMLHYVWPQPSGEDVKEVAVVAIGTGRNNRARWFTVFEKLR